jgi:hypothetical protein
VIEEAIEGLTQEYEQKLEMVLEEKDKVLGEKDRLNERKFI